MFRSNTFLPDALVARLTATRVNDPEFAWRAALTPVRRPQLTPTGRLNILTADHPTRYVTKAGDEAPAMADRRDYPARILRVLCGARVDGVMATMDILEDPLAMADAAGGMVYEGWLMEQALASMAGAGGTDMDRLAARL